MKKTSSAKTPVSLEEYPGDKSLHDLLISQNAPKRNVQLFLKKRGIISTSKSLSHLVGLVTTLILDETDLAELTSFTNIKSNRVKISHLTMHSQATLDEIFSQLHGMKFKLLNHEYRVNLPKAIPSIRKSKEDNTITVKLDFERFDFNKNILMQKELHDLTYKIKSVGKNQYDITLTSSTSEAQQFFEQVTDKVTKITGKETSVSQFFKRDIEDVSLFFNELLKSQDHGFTFKSALTVKMELRKEEPAEDGKANDEKKVKRKEPKSIMKSLSVSGKNILAHSDVKRFLNQGYSMHAVTAEFVENKSESVDHILDISMEFNQFELFQTEIKKCEEVLNQEGYARSTLGLGKLEKEFYLSRLNKTAHSVFRRLYPNAGTFSNTAAQKSTRTTKKKTNKKI